MKKAKTLWLGIVQIIGTCALIPLYFVKLMHEVGVLPTEDGGIVETHYYYSIYDKMGQDSFAVWIMIIIALASIVGYVFNIVHEGENNKKCWIAFIAQIVVFLVLLFIADAFYHYCY